MATKAKAAATAAKAIAKLTNAQLWDAVRKESPTFASHTAAATKELFTEKGFAQLTATNTQILNEFFNLSIRVALNVVNISHAKDPLAEAGFGEAFEQPFGGITQRMAVNSIKPVSPAYKNLVDGQSVDPFVVRKQVMNERFYEQNFDYQSFITLQDFNLKQIFISEYGVSELVAGVMEGLQNGWTIQRYENKLEVLNAALNDTSLKKTQQIGVEYSGTWTDETLKSFLLTVMNTISAMTVPAQTSAFNMAGFASNQDKSRLKLLVRAGFLNALRVRTLAGTFNPEQLNLDVDIVEVENFGGITYALAPAAEGGTTTPLYEVYNGYGEMIGLNTTADATTAAYQPGDADVIAVDLNADVIAILADKGFMFETLQNDYTVEAIHNPRGKYDNYWASAPNNGIHYDRVYNVVVFVATKTEPEPEPTPAPAE